MTSTNVLPVDGNHAAQPPSWKTRIVHADQHPYPDIYSPTAPYPVYKPSPLFEDAQLTTPTGEVVPWQSLKGKSVALYFADFSKPKCKTFLPLLVDVYRTFNESGDTQKVEVIFVSLDDNQDQYKEHRSKQPWLALPHDSKVIRRLRQHFRVMAAGEAGEFGFGPRLGVPALLVVTSEGRLLQSLDVGEEGRNVLKKWDVIGNRF